MALTGIVNKAITTISAGWTAFNTLITDLSSTDNAKGASCVGVEDAAGNLTATDVESAIAEIYSDHSSTRTLAEIFDENSATTTGLTWGYKAGKIRVDNVVTDIAAGTLAVTDDDVNYVEISQTGVVSRNTTGFTAGSIPIRQITAASGVQTVSTDKRAWFVQIGTASETSEGAVELATDAETVTGTAIDVVTTPANITAKIDTDGTLAGNLDTRIPSQKAVKTFGDGKVSDTAYAASWDTVTTIAPSKNAVYDQIAAMVTTIGGIPNRNLLINGCMTHAQRGASGAAAFTDATNSANTDDNYLLDRWVLLSDGNNIVDVSQVAAGGVSGKDMYQRLDVETAAKKFGIFQVIENKNCKSILGSVASVSVEIRVSDITKLSDIRMAVFSWASTADAVTSDVVGTWEAEGTIITPAANWTAENVAANLGVTAAWVKYKIENISIDTASAANVGVFIYSNNVATNDTPGVFLDVTNAQLEKGAVATDFEYRDVGYELTLCQKRYRKSYQQGVVPGTADTDGSVRGRHTASASADYTMERSAHFPVMAGEPTIVSYDDAGTAGKVSMAAGDGITGTAYGIGDSGFYMNATNGAAATNRSLNFHYTATVEL